MKKQQIAGGLNGLLQAATPQEQGTTNPAPSTRPVTYNLTAEVLEKVRYIAFVERKARNAIVGEALAQYTDKWEQANGKIPVSL